jgi:hypothetical protein
VSRVGSLRFRLGHQETERRGIELGFLVALPGAGATM